MIQFLVVGSNYEGVQMKDIEIPVHILDQAKKSVFKEVKDVEYYSPTGQIPFQLVKVCRKSLQALGERYFIKHGMIIQLDKLLEESIELSHAIKQCQKNNNGFKMNDVLRECFDLLFLIEYQLFRFTDPFLMEKIYKEKIAQLEKGLENG